MGLFKQSTMFNLIKTSKMGVFFVVFHYAVFYYLTKLIYYKYFLELMMAVENMIAIQEKTITDPSRSAR